MSLLVSSNISANSHLEVKGLSEGLQIKTSPPQCETSTNSQTQQLFPWSGLLISACAHVEKPNQPRCCKYFGRIKIKGCAGLDGRRQRRRRRREAGASVLVLIRASTRLALLRRC